MNIDRVYQLLEDVSHLYKLGTHSGNGKRYIVWNRGIVYDLRDYPETKNFTCKMINSTSYKEGMTGTYRLTDKNTGWDVYIEVCEWKPNIKVLKFVKPEIPKQARNIRMVCW